MQELIQFLIELRQERAYARLVIDIKDGQIAAPIEVTRRYKLETLPVRDRSRLPATTVNPAA